MFYLSHSISIFLGFNLIIKKFFYLILPWLCFCLFFYHYFYLTIFKENTLTKHLSQNINKIDQVHCEISDTARYITVCIIYTILLWFPEVKWKSLLLFKIIEFLTINSYLNTLGETSILFLDSTGQMEMELPGYMYLIQASLLLWLKVRERRMLLWEDMLACCLLQI